ncbi:MAG: ROK family protein [Verrucomicrobiota bacterium]
MSTTIPADLFNQAIPAVKPRLDPAFRPAVLVNRVFRRLARESGAGVPVRLALEQADGSVFHHATEILPAAHPLAAANFLHLERMVKFLMWSRGGYRVYVDGPADLGTQLQRHFTDTATGRFDADIMGTRIYEHPFEVVLTRDLPREHAATMPLGRHLDGCRIGFDLGGSDRKVAAVIDGNVVFSEETVWDPYHQPDPQYHFDGIMDSLRKAAAHLPKVEAIGGSAAGVYVNNQVKVASLFRGVPADVFQKRVKRMFFDVQKAWGGIPLEVVNDGEVTALAGSMSAGRNGVLGLALGTSQAAGYVNNEGNITSWLNELAFAPVDYAPQAPCDEWSGDAGCGVQYFSQQAVGRLLAPAGISLPAELPLPKKLKEVQKLMEQGDRRTHKIFETIGVYLGYAIAHYAELYAFQNVLILGRVTSGCGGEIILFQARHVLDTEFRDLSQHVTLMTPDEKDKRHGQAIAAASLPKIQRA